MAITITILGVRAISTKANIIMGFWWLQWSWHHEIHSESTGEKVRIFLSWNGAPILWHSWRAITTPHEPSWWAVFLITCHHDGRSSYSHTVMTGCHLMSWWAIVLKARHHLQGDRLSSTRRAHHDGPSSSRWRAIIFKVTCHYGSSSSRHACHDRPSFSRWCIMTGCHLRHADTQGIVNK